MSKIKLFSGMDFSGKTTIINGINEKMPSKFSIKKKFLTPIDLIENVRKRDTWLSPEEWKPLLQENIQKDIKEYKENDDDIEVISDFDNDIINVPSLSIAKKEKNIDDVISKIQKVVEEVKELGFEAKLEEYDFDGLYQFVIKVDNEN